MKPSTVPPFHIVTFTRRVVNPFDLRQEDISLLDIAQALAHVNRFLGHTSRPISVAEHSIRISNLLSLWYPNNKDLALAGLLHDASEAYLMDVPSPLKAHPVFAKYHQAERRAEAAIAAAFGVEHLHSPAGWDSRVKEADREAFDYEWRHRWGTERGPCVSEVRAEFYRRAAGERRASEEDVSC